jgi:uncharacterized protein (TIGR03437 family)
MNSFNFERLRHSLFLLLVASVVPSLLAQSFVYTNDSVGVNTVSGWSVDTTGKLTLLAGSPFATKGNAGNVALFDDMDFTATRIVASKAANLLFVSNDSDGSISVFNVNASTGTLTLVNGSPFQALGACNTGYSLAVTPDGKTLVAGTSCSAALQVYAVKSDGSLTAMSNRTLTGCSSPGFTGSLKITSDGTYLAAANKPCSTVETFQLTSGSALQPVTGSPFKQGSGAQPAYGLDINCLNTSLYTAGSSATQATSTADAFALSGGTLSHLSGAPYSVAGLDLQSPTLTVNDQFLVVSGWYSTKFTVFQVGPGGSLSQVPGSPFGFGDLSPAQVVPSADGKFIFFAEDTGDPGYTPGVGVLSISSAGVLTQVAGSPFRNPVASLIGGNDALTAFPPKSCQAAGPVLSSNPSSVTLSATSGASAQQTVTLTNTGGASLTISNIKVADNVGVNLDLTSCLGTTLQPGQSCTLGVTYVPQGASPVTSSIVVTNTGSPASLSIPFSGTTQGAAAPGFTFTPSPLVFQNTVLNTATGLQQIRLTNIGTTPLKVTGATVSDPANFKIDASGCAAISPLPAGSGCTVYVQFHPVTLNSFTATFNVQTDSQSNSAGTLTGRAIAAKACADADGDGLCDDWEQNGVYVLGGPFNNQYILVDLPKMGSNWQHKDLFIQADWMESNPTRPGYHSHQPRLNAMDIATKAYANGPVSNPDGKTGVTLHVDCGPECIMNPLTGAKWGNLSLATNLVELQPFADIDGSDSSVSYDWTNFDSYSTGFNESGRKYAFHHAIFAHDQAQNTSSSGISRNDGSSTAAFARGASDLIVSLGSWDAAGKHTDLAEAGTLMHETGHNLSLEHGGADNYGYKANYLSVMNYTFQTNGLIINSKQNMIDYSRFVLPALDEYHLDETKGLNGGNSISAYGTGWYCPGDVQPVAAHMTNTANGPIDWSCDGSIQDKTTVATDTRGAYDKNLKPYGITMTAQNDWDHLNFKGGAVGGAGVGDIATGPVTPLEEWNVDKASVNVPLTRVRVNGPSAIALAPGSSAVVKLSVTNSGQLADSYTISAPNIDGWFAPSNLPATVNLQPGATASVSVTVSTPSTAKAGDRQIAVVLASSTQETLIDTAQIVINVVAGSNQLALSTPGVNLGASVQGKVTAPATVTLVNTGTGALNLGNIVITGDFAQTNDCGGSIPAGTSCTLTILFTPTATGIRTGTITINDASVNGPHIITLQGNGLVLRPVPQVDAAVSAATALAGPVSPGTIISLYGRNLAVGQTAASSLPLPQQIGGASLLIGGYPAAFFYGDANQINAQVPFELGTGPAYFQLTTADGHIASGTLTVAAVSPGVFMIPGGTHAAAENADYSVNMANRPATAGGIMVLYFTGQGALDQTVPTGSASPSAPPANIVAPVTVTVAGVSAKVLFAGMTPTAAGLAQANIILPSVKGDGSPFTAGDYPVVVTVGGVAAPPVLVSIVPAQ